MNNKTLIYTIISVIVIIAFLAGAYVMTNGSGTAQTIIPEMKIISTADHVKWSPEKKNILVEYSDFQCPACKNINDLMKPFEASGSPDFKISQNVTLVYRHFPLFQIHKSALQASYAAEAASRQGKFFEMGDKLFDTQTSWESLPNPNDYFVKLATDLQLDINQFKKDMDSKGVKQKVDDDLASGNKAGVNSTPTFYLNGKKLDEIGSIDQFKQLLLSPSK